MGEAEGGNCTRGRWTCDTTIMLGHRTARRLCLSGSLLCLIAATAALAAQDAPKIKPSQHGSVSQRVADTTIALKYNRPVARGRDLFGALVPYGKIGARVPTTRRRSSSRRASRSMARIWPQGILGLDHSERRQVDRDLQSSRRNLAHPLPGRPGRAPPRSRHASRLAHGDAGVLLSGSRREKG